VNLSGHRLPNRRILVSALAWIGGAGAAVVVAMLALSLIGDGLGTGTAQPLSADATGPIGPERSLPTSPAPSPRPTTGRPSPGPRRDAAPARTAVAVTRLLSSSGGTAVARCQDDRVYLVSWSPAQGYRADEVWRGPARVARVSFESSQREVTIEARCVNGTPAGRVYVGWDEPGEGTSPGPTPGNDDSPPSGFPTSTWDR
jgi:hypothetical protein